ncbi:MAG: hypothetical protein HY825_01495 [Acidobacteria bacterium]|nr:hypothetical protein [Acidobacteriota bacterium]
MIDEILDIVNKNQAGECGGSRERRPPLVFEDLPCSRHEGAVLVLLLVLQESGQAELVGFEPTAAKSRAKPFQSRVGPQESGELLDVLPQKALVIGWRGPHGILPLKPVVEVPCRRPLRWRCAAQRSVSATAQVARFQVEKRGPEKDIADRAAAERTRT